MNSTIHRADSDKFVNIEITNGALQKNQLKNSSQTRKKEEQGECWHPR